MPNIHKKRRILTTLQFLHQPAAGRHQTHQSLVATPRPHQAAPHEQLSHYWFSDQEQMGASS